MSEFKKGQLVACRDLACAEWILGIFDGERDDGFYVRLPLSLTCSSKRPERFLQVKPAEEVWPEIFLACDREAIDKLNAQIEWLCSNLAGALNEGKLCPPNARCDGRVECEDCWSFAAEIATEETCPQ